MPGFMGIELGSRALRSFQLALNATGHNIANVNTPGYSRQRVAFVQTPDYSISPQLRIGTGVAAQSIQRLRDMMLEIQYNGASSQQSQMDTLRQSLRQIEGLFNEPSDQGINHQLASLFNAFEELATRPDSLTVRQTVLQKATTLAATFRQLDESLNGVNFALNENSQAYIREVNRMAAELAQVNVQIRAAHTTGGTANDQLDRRDLLMSRLSELTGARAQYAQDGSVMVFVGEHTLVQDNYASPLPTQLDVTNRALVGPNGSFAIPSGLLRGAMDAMNHVSQYRAELNTLAQTIISTFNAIHQTGFDLNGNTGLMFFDGTGAADMRLHADMSNAGRIAAASVGNTPGDSGIAQALTRLRNDPQAGLGGVSITTFYRNLIGIIGNDSQTYKNESESQKLIVEHLNNLRETISGVSLDEEAANLVKYQRSYQAAAKMISTFDSLIGDLLQFVTPR
jgi:flagellar hook-associated protein 1 FlgK